MTLIILLVTAIVIINGLLSMMETAFFSVPLVRVRMWAETSWRGRILLQLKTHSEIPLVTLISLSNITTIVGSMLVGSLVTTLYGSEWIGITSGVLTFIIVVFSEIVPKRLGDRFNQSISLNVAPILRTLAIIFWPLTWLIRKILSPFTAKTHLPVTSEAEISWLAELAGREGSIETDESDLIKQVFTLNDVTVKDLMIDKNKITVLRSHQALIEVQPIIINSRQLYLPVINQEAEPIGVVYRPNLMTALLKGYRRLTVKDLCQSPLLVSLTDRADHLLEDFRRSGQAVALVVDTQGQLVGQIELEKVLEHLVGSLSAKPAIDQ